METLYTVKEAADILKVTATTVYRAVETGDLPCLRFGRTIRITEEGLRSYMKPSEPKKTEPETPPTRRIVTKIT